MAAVREVEEEQEEELEETFLSDVHLSTSFLRTKKGKIGEFRVLMVL